MPPSLDINRMHFVVRPDRTVELKLTGDQITVRVVVTVEMLEHIVKQAKSKE